VARKEEIVMLVPETADGFQSTNGDLRSLNNSEGVIFTPFAPRGYMLASLVEKTEFWEELGGLAHQPAGCHPHPVSETLSAPK
jgi:hypothetical protein